MQKTRFIYESDLILYLHSFIKNYSKELSKKVELHHCLPGIRWIVHLLAYYSTNSSILERELAIGHGVIDLWSGIAVAGQGAAVSIGCDVISTTSKDKQTDRTNAKEIHYVYFVLFQKDNSFN